MAEQVGGMILEKIVEKLVDPIIRQFSYLFCYKSNIKTLQDKMQDIQNTKIGVTLQVDRAKRKLETIDPDVEAWLGKVENIGKTADEILQGTDKVTNGCLNGQCPNLKQRYLLSRKAVKQTVIVKELRSQGEKHTKLSYPTLPASMEVFPSTAAFEVFESRVSKTKEVIEALKNKNLMKIGICGLGGIGKTKMANDVRDRVKIENLFDDVRDRVKNSHEIVNLFSPSAARCLVQLQQLGVYDCNKLKEIVWKDESDTNMIGFPKLKEMRLSWLPSFKSFVAVDYNNHSGSIFNEVLLPSMEETFWIDDVVKLVDGNPAASYNKLETIEVDNCRSMEVVFDLEGVDVVVNENREKVIVFSQLHTISIFHLHKLKHIWKNGPKEIRLQAGSHFQNLKSLNLQYCRKIEYVLSVSMAKLVVNLEEIEIFYCKSMEQVIKMDDDDDDDEEGITRERDKIVFPQLRKLRIVYVGLKVFCQGNHHLEFPALEKVYIESCPNMNNFCSGSLSTPNLMSVQYRTDMNNLLIWKGDLNKTVQYIYQSYDDDDEEEEE